MRLIDADALKEEFARHEDRKGYIIGDPDVIIDNAPTVELRIGRMTNGIIIPIERPTGEWIKETSGYYCWFRCNKCKSHITSEKTNYCPNCGARMEVEE